MYILGIETSTNFLSAAVIDESGRVFSRDTDSKSMHCELLPGYICDILKESGILMENIDCIAVSIGPGSFTGLRIGISTAAGLAYGLGKKVAGVNTLVSLAWDCAPTGALVCPVIDAKRSEFYAGIYRVTGGIPETVMESIAIPQSMLAEKIARFNEKIIITGPAANLFEKTAQESNIDYKLAPPEKQNPSAVSIARLGMIMVKAGYSVNPALLEPVYLRRSDAELAKDAGKSFFQKKY